MHSFYWNNFSIFITLQNQFPSQLKFLLGNLESYLSEEHLGKIESDNISERLFLAK